MKNTAFLPCICAILCGLAGLFPGKANAHPMGNFSINHYARFEARNDVLALRYILDFAEIPTTELRTQLDSDGNSLINEGEKRAFLATETAKFADNLTVTVDSKPASLQLRSSKLDLRPGAGGLDTLRVISDFEIALSPGQTHSIAYNDLNFPARTGWMEVVALAAPGRTVRDSTASAKDQSRELTFFPLDATIVPPRQTTATFSITAPGSTAGSAPSIGTTSQSAASPLQNGETAPSTNTHTPQNRFTQAIAPAELTPGLFLGGILVALLFGAVHAFSPGHGKTMVAAYLVGTRGTPRHAVILGLVVTITHTFGVFLLGLATLFAARYIVPERLFPALSAASGLIIFGVGLWLLMSRFQSLSADQGHSHEHGAEGHTHDHDPDHEHSHAPGHVHSHGGRAHSHAVPEGPVTLKTLVALGISGGIVPCPEALVVLLAAVKLHRIAYGMLLIFAFSIGLAAALIAIGLIVVVASRRLSGLDRFAGGRVLTRYLPIGSAAIITIIGIAMTLSAAGGKGP